jgi:D-serine deaminase-like pyridoxal phosphate-dependent protein
MSTYAIAISTVSAAIAAMLLLRAKDQGGAYPPYFQALNAMLLKNGPGRPLMLIDRVRLLENCRKVREHLPAKKDFRIVAKSLGSLPLLKLVMEAMGTNKLMVFHQPHLNVLAEAFPQSDLLLGKPMPVRAAHTFYATLNNTAFNPVLQLQWLIDTAARLLEYQQLAQTLGTKIRVNIELDVGLHRGGVGTTEELLSLLAIIHSDHQHLEFAGFMGYDAHVGKIPAVLESREKSFKKSCDVYRAMQNALYANYPELNNKSLTFNGAGSPTLRLHHESSPLNELAAGSCLVKPTDFDLGLLADLEPAAFIAAPVLKIQQGTTIPGIEGLRNVFTKLNPNRQRSYFIYGGLWKARYESPPGLIDNSLYGKSSNQAIINSSCRTPLQVNDHIFLRPTQSECVLQEFDDIAVLDNGAISEWWPVLPT